MSGFIFFCCEKRRVYKEKPEKKGASVGELAKILGAAYLAGIPYNFFLIASIHFYGHPSIQWLHNKQ